MTLIAEEQAQEKPIRAGGYLILLHDQDAYGKFSALKYFFLICVQVY